MLPAARRVGALIGRRPVAALIATILLALASLTIAWSLPAEHEDVQLRVRGLPSSATLTWGGKRLPGNPAYVPRSSKPVELVISSPGYKTLTTDVVPSEDLDFHAELIAKH
jgi:hypothetical protein